MADHREKYHIQSCTILKETAKAILVECPDFEEDVWIPKSQVDDASEVWEDSADGRGPGTLVVNRWFANKQGWV